MDLITRKTGPRVTLSYVVCWFLLTYVICAVAVEINFPRIAPLAELGALKALTIQILTSLMFLSVVWFSSDCMSLIRRSVGGPVRKVDWLLLILVAITSVGWAVGFSRLLTVLPRVWIIPVDWNSTAGIRAPEQLKSWMTMLQPIVGAVILAPLVEELAFRGVMLPAWLQARGVVVSVLATSALFGLMHGAERVIMASVGGILFALLYLHYRSIWPGVLVHALHNLLVQPEMLGRLAFGKLPEESHQLAGWRYEIGLSIAMLVCGVLAWRRARRTQQAQASSG